LNSAATDGRFVIFAITDDGKNGTGPFCLRRRHRRRKVRNPYSGPAAMLAKLTAKNQLTLPKAATASVAAAEYFDVQTRDGAIVLTPVRIQRGDAVRAKLAELDIDSADVDAAIAWARQRVAEAPAAYPAKPAPRPRERKP
jgi:hypothetical protein